MIVNESFFEIIDTEIKAYLLGFITADGCITHHREKRLLQVHISAKDSYVVSLLENFVGNTTVTYISEKYNSVSFRVESEKICSDLEKYGIVSRKTGKETLAFNMIPKSLLNHYIRGLIDGDGWISVTAYKYGSKRVVGFCGSELACEMMSVMLNKLLVTYKLSVSKVRGKDNYKINYSGKSDVDKIVKFLYTDANFYLERKFIEATKKFVSSDKMVNVWK